MLYILQTAAASLLRPRLCKLRTWPHFQGYGFNLRSDPALGAGSYVMEVDQGSPAEATGLKADDKVIEVNGVNVEHSKHKDIVRKIQARQYEVNLLLASPETRRYYDQKKVQIRSDTVDVVLFDCPREGADGG